MDANGSIVMNGVTAKVDGPTNSGNGVLDYDGKLKQMVVNIKALLFQVLLQILEIVMAMVEVAQVVEAEDDSVFFCYICRFIL